MAEALWQTLLQLGPSGGWYPYEVVLAQYLKLKPEMVRYLTCLVLLYPLALLHRQLPSTGVRHVVSLVAGLGLAWANFGGDTLHFVASSGVAYLMCMAAPRQPMMPACVFLWVLGYISWGHIQRMYMPGGDFGGPVVHWTSPQMLLTIKITSFAWAYHDAQRSPAVLASLSGIRLALRCDEGESGPKK